MAVRVVAVRVVAVRVVAANRTHTLGKRSPKPDRCQRLRPDGFEWERNLCGEWLCGGGGDGDCAVVCVVAAIRRNRSENGPPCPETMSATVTMLPVDGYAIMTDMLIITHVRDDGEHQEDGVACSKICMATKYVWRRRRTCTTCTMAYMCDVY